MLENSGDPSPYLLLLPDLVFFQSSTKAKTPMPLNYSKCLGLAMDGQIHPMVRVMCSKISKIVQNSI